MKWWLRGLFLFGTMAIMLFINIAASNGFNNPQYRYEVVLCVLLMIVAPLAAAHICTTFVTHWIKQERERIENDKQGNKPEQPS
jgi:hypothetical protein